MRQLRLPLLFARALPAARYTPTFVRDLGHAARKSTI
jgi:hypothetical protein